MGGEASAAHNEQTRFSHNDCKPEATRARNEHTLAKSNPVFQRECGSKLNDGQDWIEAARVCTLRASSVTNDIISEHKTS